MSRYKQLLALLNEHSTDSDGAGNCIIKRDYDVVVAAIMRFFEEGGCMTDDEFDLLMTVAAVLRESLVLGDSEEMMARLREAMSKFAPWPYVANHVSALGGREA